MKIEDIREKTKVSGNFLVSRKDMAVSKNGKAYIMARLMDSTGEVEARVWDNAEAVAANFKKDDVCRVEGFAVSYQGSIQVNISAMASLPEDKFTLRDFLPATVRDPEEMFAELTGIISTMTDTDIKGFFDILFSKDGEVLELFKLSPAAKGMHHNRLGGLLEHVLSVAKLAVFISSHYDNIDRDLLIAGVILHDIGKIHELSYKRSFDYTDRGQLIGHITIGAGMVDEITKQIEGFPEEKAMLMQHMVLSHHGVLEFGSPKVPMTVEAVILSFIDDLDAKVEATQRYIDNDQGETNWTAYHRLLGRFLFKGFPKDGPAPAPPKDDSPPAPASPQDDSPPAAPPSKDDGDLDLF
ncbi:MAG: HD domain-containing protein [Thermodesulfobacteriota bacterium]